MLFYLEDRPSAALEFMDEVEDAIAEIAAFPDRYPVYLEDIRVKRLDVFPFSLFYRIRLDHVLILSVSHDSRRADHWEDRV